MEVHWSGVSVRAYKCLTQSCKCSLMQKNSPVTNCVSVILPLAYLLYTPATGAADTCMLVLVNSP